MDFWQARPPQWSQQQRHGAAAAPIFYFAKFRQGLGLGGLASLGGPDIEYGLSMTSWSIYTLLLFSTVLSVPISQQYSF